MRPQTKRENNSGEVEKWFAKFYDSLPSRDDSFARLITAGFKQEILGRAATFGNRGTGLAHNIHVMTGGDDYYKRREENLKEVTQTIKLWAYKDPMDASSKILKLKSELRTHHGPNAQLPQTPILPEQAIRQYQLKKDLLEIKIDVLRYWIDVFEERVSPDISDAVGSVHRQATNLKYHYFLQADKNTVNKILNFMLDDAHSIIEKPKFTLSSEAKMVLTGSRNVKITKEFLNYAINADAAFAVGAKWEGAMEVEYTGFKGKLEASAFAGAQGKVDLSAVANADTLALQAGASVFVGIKLEGKARVDFDYLLNVELGGEAIAGALATAKAKLVIDKHELSAEASAEVFAGLKLEGTAKAEFKLAGITCASWEGTAAATMGIGAKAHAEFKCGIFGAMSVGAGAGITAGIGTETGVKFGVQKKELAVACEQLYFDGLHVFGANYKGYRHKIVPEANLVQAVKLIQYLGVLKTRLATNQADLISTLDDWDDRMDRLGFSSKDKRLTHFV